MRRGHPFIAAVYDRLLHTEERRLLGGLRDEVVGLAKGTVVEIGVGTGLNFSHYRADAIAHFYAVEPDPFMRRQAERRAAAIAFPIEFLAATAEQLPLPDQSVDTVVTTLVLCSVDDPDQASREMHRVLKRDGHLLLIEHVRAGDGWRATVQDVLAPFWRRVAANCHPNRATLDDLRDAGFTLSETRRISSGMPLDRPLVAAVGSVTGTDGSQ